ncbi:FAD-binding oxidoreductase [Maribellus maritimus]|uniref:FAD-binding oxidoreductase n=1 Tax=Maribellus maritimus TaxID=2870838 RepID=UPI001EECBB7F|nr:FAD-binding oxidoreductase [Maribellus maritimus]MCG6186255.1 flavodoxin reductase [Maribellus maritimus]
MEYKVKIEQKKWLTHDVIQLLLKRPADFSYKEGQAIEATIDSKEYKDAWSPFTLTSLNKDEDLQLTIKVYPKHNGVTLALSKLKEGDSFLITEPWDSFKNKGSGVFIAGGTGVTPFIALLRQMEVDGNIDGSTLIFSNKSEKDIFLFDEFKRMLGDNFINVLTREKNEKYLHGRINKRFLKEQFSNFNQPFYLCGPDNFADDIKLHLKELGAGDDLVNVSL